METGLGEQFAADNVDADSVAFERYGDIRYVGQGYEIRVPMPLGTINDGNITEVFDAFHSSHKAEYGHFFADSPIEIVNIRVVGIAPTPKIARHQPAASAKADSLVKSDQCYFSVNGQLESIETKFHQRDALANNDEIEGPAVILQKDATTVVPPGWTARVDSARNLLIRDGGLR